MKLSLEEAVHILELDERKARISEEEALELVRKVGDAYGVDIRLTWTTRRRRGQARVGEDINTVMTGPLVFRGSLHSTIHELGHVANYWKNQSRGHGRDFYDALKGVILICGLKLEDYCWATEYSSIRRWAVKEGLYKKKEEGTMLEQGKWYKNVGEPGVIFVEKVGQSFAEIKVITGKVKEVEFTTGDGTGVEFTSFETKRTTISPSAGLELASADEVARFTTDRQRAKAEATQTSKVEEAKREKKDHGKATHSIEFTPEVKQRKKAKSTCSYKDGKPGGYRLVWTYEDGLRTFCRACSEHAKRFSERHGCPIPKHPRSKKAKA